MNIKLHTPKALFQFDLAEYRESDDSLSKAWAKEFFRHVEIVNKANQQYKE